MLLLSTLYYTQPYTHHLAFYHYHDIVERIVLDVTMMTLSNAVDHDHDIGGHALSAAHDDGDNDKDLYFNLSKTSQTRG